jgi:hypothetical protein
MGGAAYVIYKKTGGYKTGTMVNCFRLQGPAQSPVCPYQAGDICRIGPCNPQVSFEGTPFGQLCAPVIRIERKWYTVSFVSAKCYGATVTYPTQCECPE